MSKMYPTTIEEYVDELRGTIMDYPELNHVLLEREDNDNKEFTDEELKRALKQALAKINSYPPITRYTFETFPSQYHSSLLVDLAIARLLMMKGILKTRNAMPYQDNGGITVSFQGKNQQYISIAQMFYQTAMEELNRFKTAMSISQGWGGVHSPYIGIPW